MPVFTNMRKRQHGECVTTPSAARVLNPRSAFAPFDGILGRITEPLARAASEIEIPAVNAWLNSPAESVTSVVADFETLRQNGRSALDRSGFSSVRLHGVPSRKRCPLSSSRIQGHPETAWFSFLKLPFPRTDLGGEGLGWEKFLKGLEQWVEAWEPPIGVLVTTDLYCRHLIETCRAKG